jgi:uncharacterized protein YggE
MSINRATFPPRSPVLHAIAMSAACLLWAAAPGQASDRPLAPSPVPTISVTGEGRAEAVPDMASIRIGITAQAATAAEALAQSSAAVSDTLDRLDAAGIEARDRQTTGLSLQPDWDYGREGNTPPRIIGYTAQNGVTVRVRDLAMLGGLLDAVVSGGANRLDGLSFTVADPAPLLDEARRRAVADARRRATLYAEAAGVTLGAVLAISDGPGASAAMPMLRSEMAMMSDAAVPIAEGEVELSARVQIVYAIAE